MSLFNSPSDFNEYKKYVPLLKKALAHVGSGEPKKFLYFKEFLFNDKKSQCVLVDYSAQCQEALKKSRRLPTAEGTVTLTAQDELNFESHKGTFKAIWLKKYFATIGDGIKEVLVDLNEVEDDAAAAPAFTLATPPAGKSVRPSAPTTPALQAPPAGQHGGPNAPAAHVAAPTGVRPATATPPAPPPQRAQPIAGQPAAQHGGPNAPAARVAAPGGPRPAAATPAALPPQRAQANAAAPAGQHGGPNAPVARVAAPGGPRPATATPAASPPQRAQPNAAQPAAVKVAAAPKPPAAVAMPLPENKGEQEAMVEDYIAALRKADLPIKDPGKQHVLDKALELSNSREYAHALDLLNKLVRDVEYPGVEEWALQKPSRKYEVELLTEQFFGFLNLIDHKRRQPGDFIKEETEISELIVRAKSFNDGINNGLLAANPADVKKAFDLWAPLVKRKKELANELKQIWLADQTARLKREAEKSKSSSNVRMANSYGKDAVMELAQMAEIQAIRFKAAPQNKEDPLAKGDWHEKLEVAELAAIYGYSTADYTAIGQLLRGKAPDNDAQKKAVEESKAKFAEYIEAAKKGLAKLPSYKGGPGVRCTKSLWQETINEIATTGAHVEKSFMSVGKKKVAGFGDIEWHFDKFKTGKDITMFSLHQTEGEILFPPGSKFKFIKGEVLDAAGQKVEFSDARQFATHVTPETKIGKFWFEQSA